MNKTNAYRKQDLFGGWTRVDLLLHIYDRAIDSLNLAQEAQKQNNGEFAEHFVAAQKAIVAIHAGLKPDEHQIAYDTARLLHFVLTCLESNQLADAVKILTNMRSGFAAIQEEANESEANGEIPSMHVQNQFAANV